MSDIDDIDDVDDVHDRFDRLDDVYDKLVDIERAIKNQTQNWGTAVFWVVVFWLVIPFFSSMWHSKFRYSVQYDVPNEQITIDKEPKDCNFLHAPIGGKDCHYERQVAASKVKGNQWGGQDVSYNDGKTWTRYAKNDNGNWIVSYDNGTTWSISSDTGDKKPSVSVYWVKKDDD